MSEQVPLQTFYDAVGGHGPSVALLKWFYEGVASDPPLRALYPEPDLASAAESGFGCSLSILGRSDHL